MLPWPGFGLPSVDEADAPAMTPAEGISRFGFRNWYERELIEGHAYFVTCILSLLLTAACVEQLDWQGPLTELGMTILALVLGAALCVGALQRYGFLLARAECFGAQSNCAQCSAYGVLTVTGVGTTPAARSLLSPADNTWIRVRCKRCGHEWRIENS
jgi:hypothetical protein